MRKSKLLSLSIGTKVGNLTFLGSFKRKNNTILWKCQCDCLNITFVRSSFLNGKRSKKNCKSCNQLSNNHQWKGYGEISGTYFTNLKTNALIRNHKFTITKKQLWKLFLKQNRKCALSGLELKFNSKSKIRDGNASLDRIDSSKGYIKNNIQWIHKDINYMKLDYTQNEFIRLCKLIAKQNQ